MLTELPQAQAWKFEINAELVTIRCGNVHMKPDELRTGIEFIQDFSCESVEPVIFSSVFNVWTFEI